MYSFMLSVVGSTSWGEDISVFNKWLQVIWRNVVHNGVKFVSPNLHLTWMDKEMCKTLTNFLLETSFRLLFDK